MKIPRLPVDLSAHLQIQPKRDSHNRFGCVRGTFDSNSYYGYYCLCSKRAEAESRRQHAGF